MRCYLNLTPNEEAKALQRSHHVFALQSIEQHYFQKLSPKSIVYDVYCNYKYHPSPVIGNHSILFLSGSNQFNINGFTSSKG